ncbi:hypothetical protein HD553DRAFT_325078 [Filobasidium floriforme]|uniref:uncharacterized protein n=1 Tax=Filobasidium floriforme TaxID=5210 RepID=UPI001E8DCA2B|nr:uncharacterized protein HD553DRAFT_325078 [Filobasidium floriforme]KAH8082221.1 hypothetical protein HD553DRAFT_325078 [Filobasidium floriforme]
MNEPSWGNPTLDSKLTDGHQPGLHDGFRLPPLNFPLSSVDIKVRNIPSPIEPNWTNPYAQNPSGSYLPSRSTLGQARRLEIPSDSHYETRTVPDDLTQLRKDANLYSRPEELSNLAKQLLPEGKRSESFIKFVTLVLQLRIKLKLNFREKAVIDLEESISAFAIQDQQSAVSYASVRSSFHSEAKAPVHAMPLDSGTTLATTLYQPSDPEGAPTTGVVHLTPRSAWINKYSRKANPDQDLLKLVSMTLLREDSFLVELDQYLAARQVAGTLNILLPEVIMCDERCRVFRPNEGKDFPALVTLASEMLPDDQNYEVALAIAWIFQRRNRLTGNKRAIEPWKTHSRASSWDRRFFRIPDISQETLFSSKTSQTQATSLESTFIYYTPRTMLSGSTFETQSCAPPSQT